MFTKSLGNHDPKLTYRFCFKWIETTKLGINSYYIHILDLLKVICLTDSMVNHHFSPVFWGRFPITRGGNRFADPRTWKSDWSDWKDSNHGSSFLAKVLRSCSEGDCHRENGGIPSMLPYLEDHSRTSKWLITIVSKFTM